MYQYISALAKAKSKRARWEEVDLRHMLLSDILMNYSDAIITTSNTFLTGDRYVRLSDILAAGIRTDQTLEQWFIAHGEKPLNDTTAPWEIVSSAITYRDAWRSGFKIDYVGNGVHPSTPLPLGDRVNLLLTKTGIDYQEAYENLLVTVNGLLHLTDFDGNGLHVYDGGKSIQYANLNNVGLINFSHVGQLQQIPINVSMLSKSPQQLAGYAEGVYIATGVDMTGKTPMLVLGGYLHVCDDVYQVVNPELGIIKVFTKKINLMHRIFESRKLISLATLNLPTHAINAGLIQNSDLFSDSVIESYFDLPQSFIVLVDTPSMYVNKHRIDCANLDGIYYTAKDPIYPLQLRTGILPEFWVRKEEELYVLSVTDGKSRNYMFETVDWRSEPSVDEALVPDDQFEHAKAFLLEIGKESIEPI
jgi:hypothetical protein